MAPGGGETGDSGAMVVAVEAAGDRVGQVVLIVPVVAEAEGVVGGEVGVEGVDAVVHDTDGHAVAEGGVPGGDGADIDAGSAALLAGVAQVPLVAEERVVGDEFFRPRPGEQRSHGDEARLGGERGGGAERLGGVARDARECVGAGMRGAFPAGDAEIGAHGGGGRVGRGEGDVQPGPQDAAGGGDEGAARGVNNQAGRGGRQVREMGEQGVEAGLRGDGGETGGRMINQIEGDDVRADQDGGERGRGGGFGNLGESGRGWRRGAVNDGGDRGGGREGAGGFDSARREQEQARPEQGEQGRYARARHGRVRCRRSAWTRRDYSVSAAVSIRTAPERVGGASAVEDRRPGTRK